MGITLQVVLEPAGATVCTFMHRQPRNHHTLRMPGKPGDSVFNAAAPAAPITALPVAIRLDVKLDVYWRLTRCVE